MSLTSQIEGGPLREWFAEKFPNTRRVAWYANRYLCGPPTHPKKVLRGRKGSDPGLVGTSVDYLVRATISANPWPAPVAALGALDLGSYLEDPRAALKVVREIQERVTHLQPWSLDLTAAEWSELCAMCVVLGKFEQCVRASLSIAEIVPGLPRAAKGLPEFIEALVDFATLADLEALGRIAARDHTDLRECTRLHLNPTFDQSAALGGADADLISDGVLLDLKSASTRRVVSRSELWQLLGYTFADSSNVFEIRKVGISALRWRERWVVPIDWLMRELSATEEVDTLSRYREDFASFLARLKTPDPGLGENNSTSASDPQSRI